MDFNMIKKLQIPKLDLRNLDWPRFDFSAGQWPKMPELRIGDAVAKLPIIQGGMGVGISLSGLASAVANEGGIGVIAANSIGMLDPERRYAGYWAVGRSAWLVRSRSTVL